MTSDQARLRPKGLGSRGSALWKEMADETARASRLILLGEACRLADRLDKLDELLRGDIRTWAQLVDRGSGARVLLIDEAASEARSTAGALRMILGQLASGAAPTAKTATLADELEKRR